MFNLHDVKNCWQCYNFLNTKHMQVRRVWVWARAHHSWFSGFCEVRDSCVVNGGQEGEKMDEKGEADDSHCKYRASDHRAGVIMADVFLRMSLFQLRLTRSTCTQRLIESSGLDRLSLGCAGNGCLWPIITQQLLTHHADTLNKTLHTKHTRLLPMAW